MFLRHPCSSSVAVNTLLQQTSAQGVCALTLCAWTLRWRALRDTCSDSLVVEHSQWGLGGSANSPSVRKCP